MDNATPGWNDTPAFVPPPTGNLKINLKKRVAYPLSNQSAPPTSSIDPTASPSNLPPMHLPPTAILPPAASLSSRATDESSIEFDEKSEHDKIKEIFDRISSEVNNASVNAKLKSLDDEWKSYDKNLQKLIAELAKTIDERDSKSAAVIQRQIIMGGCNHQWINGVRQLISYLESKNVTEKPETE